jgi:exonuclease V gamma subunit
MVCLFDILAVNNFQKMILLDGIVKDYSPPLIAKINKVEEDGSSFLSHMDQFTETEIYDIIDSDKLYEYMKDIILNSKGDCSVHCCLSISPNRNYTVLLQLCFTFWEVQTTIPSYLS